MVSVDLQKNKCVFLIRYMGLEIDCGGKGICQIHSRDFINKQLDPNKIEWGPNQPLKKWTYFC